MATFFDSLPRSFASVPVADSDVETIPFLEAADGLSRIFDVLGAAFLVVKADIQGNITKIRTRHDQKPVINNTLQALVRAEQAEKKNVATDALLWLKRGLEFTAAGLRRNVDNPAEELAASFNKAYEATLSKHHNFVVRGVFSVAMRACPSRSDFYAKLAGSDPAKMKEQLSSWLKSLESQVRTIDDFLRSIKAEK